MLILDILNEKLVIDEIVHQKIDRALNLWSNWLQTTFAEQNVRNNNQDEIRWVNTNTNKKLVSNKLRQYLTPIVRQILNQNLPPITDPNCEGYKIKVDIDILPAFSNAGTIQQRWSKLYTVRPKYVYVNYLSLTISPDNIVDIKHNNKKVINELGSVITHELTHILQLLRSSRQSVWTSPFHKGSTELSKEERYYMKKVELDAFAQGTATSIILNSKISPDPKKYIKGNIDMIKMGMVSIFNREVVPNQQYEKIKQVLSQPSDDPKVQRAKDQAWKYYNKKIIVKLTHYLDTLV